MHGDKMTQTGKASAKPEYSFSIAFVVVLLLFFFFVCVFLQVLSPSPSPSPPPQKKESTPLHLIPVLCSVVAAKHGEGGWGRDVLSKSPARRKDPWAFSGCFQH